MTTITEKMTAEEAYEIALNDPIRRVTDKKIIEEAILSNINAEGLRWRQYIVVDYATEILRGRWREAEPLILSGKYAPLIFCYARDVVKNRWIEAEKILVDSADQDYKNNSSKDYRIVLEYYMNLICGYTFPDKSDYRYGKHFSNKRNRWFEFEHILHFIFSEVKLRETVVRDAYYCYDEQKKYWKLAHEAKKCFDHAKDVIKGRWADGEEIIKKHEYWWQEYKNFISEAPAVDLKNIELENLKKARAELDAKIKLLETQG